MSTENGKSTRRDFIRNSAVAAAGAAAASVMPTTAHAMSRIIGANDRIQIGHVGVGTQGYTAHVRLLKQASKENNTEQIAACDLYGRRLRRTQKELNLKDSQLYTDFRKMLANKDLDAVVVATSDNWHAPISIAAMEAGKHVYCEKPMCKTLEEAFAVYDACKRSKRIFQIGSQGTSDLKYGAVAKIVKSGKLGHMVVAQGNYMRGDNKIGEWNNYGEFDLDAGPGATGDAHIDWEMFRKGTDPKEWDPDRFFRWRKYWEYGSGLVGDLFPHKLHPLFVAMGLPTDGLKGFPLRVSSGGGLYVQKIHPTHDTPDDEKEKEYLKKFHPGHDSWMDREVPDFINISVDFEDASLMAMSSTINEEGWPDSIRCNKGTILFSGNIIKIKPERSYADEVDGSEEQAPGVGEPIEGHQKNWIDCIRTNSVPNGNIDLAVRVQTMISLGERAYRESRTFTFDPKTRTASGGGSVSTSHPSPAVKPNPAQPKKGKSH
jgi:predicted dehydrogenase